MGASKTYAADVQVKLDVTDALLALTNGGFYTKRISLQERGEFATLPGIVLLHSILRDRATDSDPRESDLCFGLLLTLAKIVLAPDDHVLSEWKQCTFSAKSMERVTYAVSLIEGLISWNRVGLFTICGADGEPCTFRESGSHSTDDGVLLRLKAGSHREIPLTLHPHSVHFASFHSNRPEFIRRCHSHIERVLKYPKQRRKYFVKMIQDACTYTERSVPNDAMMYIAVFDANTETRSYLLSFIGKKRLASEQDSLDLFRVLDVQVPAEMQGISCDDGWRDVLSTLCTSYEPELTVHYV